VNALVLSGGGARGAFEAGVVTGLSEGERFDIVCGTSIGALNGALVAQDEVASMRDAWREIAARKVIRLDEPLERWRRLALDLKAFRLAAAIRGARHARIPAFDRIRGLLDWEPVRTILEARLDHARIARAFVIGTTDITHGRGAAFYAFPGDADAERAFAANEPNAFPITAANYVDAVRASAAIPGAFAPVTIETSPGASAVFADGCIANNTPLRQAIDAGATRVTVVFMQHDTLRYRDHRVRHAGDVVFACQDIADQRMLELDLKLARSVNAQVLRGEAPGKRFVELRVIGPSVPLRLGALNFDDQEALDRAYDVGLNEGRMALAAAS
jgi:predicted acylesterase/phospholipase RssA